MKAVISQEGLEGDRQGYARVSIELEPGDNAAFEPSDTIALGLYQGANLEFLQPAGGNLWSGSPGRLKLESRPEISGNKGAFLLQPAYVDDLEDGTYTVYLMGADGSVKGKAQARWDDIVWSPLKGTDAVALKSFEDEEAPSKKEEPAAPAGGAAAASFAANTIEAVPDNKAEELNIDNAAAESEPSESADAREESASEETAAPLEGGGAENVEPLPQQTIPVRKKSGGLGIAIAALIALLAIGGGAWYYFGMKDNGPSAEQIAQEEAAKKAAEEAAAAKKAADEAAAAKKASEDAARAAAEKKAAEEAAAAANDARGQVQKFFAGERDPRKAMELAKSLKAETTEQQDAVFRLFYYAAENGDKEGAFAYAECLDPSKPPYGTVKKDGAEAWRFYGQADNGEDAREKLKAWTEDRAKTGNRAAREWLSEME